VARGFYRGMPINAYPRASPKLPAGLSVIVGDIALMQRRYREFPLRVVSRSLYLSFSLSLSFCFPSPSPQTARRLSSAQRSQSSGIRCESESRRRAGRSRDRERASPDTPSVYRASKAEQPRIERCVYWACNVSAARRKFNIGILIFRRSNARLV